MNNPPLCAIDEEEGNISDVERKSKKKRRKKKLIHIDSDLLVDRYHSTQKINRDNVDAFHHSSEDEIQPSSPFSPNNNWQAEDGEEEEEEEEDL